MRYTKALLLSLPLAALAMLDARDASACGGCLVQQSESTQVTGHKMVLSVSTAQTTLWDQITYSGNPAEFAWVLPIKGTVEIGLSSDALFQNLDQATQVTVASPVIQCNPPPDCGGVNASSDFGGATGSSGAGGAGGEPPVTVLAQEVVGPYETVQLESTNPSALADWLTSHGYQIPADIAPVIDAYVKEKFNFLALKLVPGQGVSAMKPVRVTTSGASPVLPLRMVAAGTGAVTSITLWVIGEGRYEPTNMPEFTIAASDLIWNWDAASSNYASLKKAAFDDSDGKAWLVEAGEQMSKYYLQDNLLYLAEYEPENSGYGDENGDGALEDAQDDLDDLFGTIGDTSLWVTRLHGELSRSALGADLELGASSNQNYVERYLQATTTIGTPPACPINPPCGLGGDGEWDFWGNGVDSNDKIGGGGCAFTAAPGVSTMMSGLVLTAALALSRRRRRG